MTSKGDRTPTSLTLREVADLVGGRVVGTDDIRVMSVAPLDEATDSDLGLFASRRYAREAFATGAGALLASEAVAALIPEHRAAVVVDDAHVAMARILAALYPEPPHRQGVHATAILGHGVRLGEDVSVGPYAVIGDDTVIEEQARIGPHVTIGARCHVGARTVVHPQVVFYDGTRVGADAIIHAGVRLGVDGFGYVQVDGHHSKVPQVGGCEIGDRVEIGANTCVDRGSIGNTRVGEGTKLDNLVHLAHNVRLGRHVLLVAQVGIAGSTRVGDGVVFGGQSGAVNHVEIGAGARVAAKTGVLRNIGPGETVMGFPARPRTEFLRAQATLSRITGMLPGLRKLHGQSDAS